MIYFKLFFRSLQNRILTVSSTKADESFLNIQQENIAKAKLFESDSVSCSHTLNLLGMSHASGDFFCRKKMSRLP